MVINSGQAKTMLNIIYDRERFSLCFAYKINKYC